MFSYNLTLERIWGKAFPDILRSTINTGFDLFLHVLVYDS